MQIWEYTSVIVEPTQSWYEILNSMGQQGWEAFFIEIGWPGATREIYFKRKVT